MNTLHIIFHLMRADFLERVRRYSFLIVLGATVFLASTVATGHIVLRLHRYRGVYNSAWVGILMTVTTTFFLSLAGFYIVKNALERDRRTGVGQIIAATPVGRLLYLLGKTLSNLAVLAVMVGILILAAVATQLIRGEDSRIELWSLISPFLLIGLPAMAVVAAVAVLFETLPGLRGGFGNVAYFFLWLFVGTYSLEHSTPFADLMGIKLVETILKAAAYARFPDYAGRFSVEILPESRILQTFRWEGIHWTPELILERLYWFGVAFGIVLITVLFFDRFDPARGISHRYDLSFKRGLLNRWLKRLPPEAAPSVASEAKRLVPAPAPVHLTPLMAAPTHFRFGQTLLAELRLMLKGQPWWWYVAALGLIVAGLSNPSDVARRQLLPFAWIWPLLIWSAMGTREVRHRTEQLVFSAAHPLRRQLAATWLGGVIVAMLAGSGVAVRLALASNWANVLAWTIGALFIPTLALALGVWSGSSKLFEVVYTVLWYVGPVNQVHYLDFMGTSSEAVAVGVPLYYLILTLTLLGLAVVGRRRQLQIW